MRVAHRVFARGRFKIICECCRFVSRHPAGVEAVQLKLDYLTHLSSIQRLNNISSPSTHSAVRAYVGQAGKRFLFFVFCFLNDSGRDDSGEENQGEKLSLWFFAWIANY